MTFVRLPLVALALLSLNACSSDALAPTSPVQTSDAASRISPPGAPLHNGQMFGSGAKEASDSMDTPIVGTSSSTTVITLQ